MFERYTEHARRTIFFARYEASVFGSAYIETEHLLLGLLREDRQLRTRLPSGAREEIRSSIEERSPRKEKSSTSADLPLSRESKRALAYGAEESERLHHKVIDCGHLVLGLLRIETCFAAVLLGQHGIDLAGYRDSVSSSPAGDPQNRPSQPTPFERLSESRGAGQSKPEAPSLEAAVAALTNLIDSAMVHVNVYAEAYGDQRLKRKPWSRKEAMGHLIDWATTHHGWFVRALTGPKLIGAGYPAEEWVSAQKCGGFTWQDLFALWLCLNRLLVHVLSRIPEEKLAIPCRIGIEEPIPLSELIARYVAHCQDILGQILARL